MTKHPSDIIIERPVAYPPSTRVTETSVLVLGGRREEILAARLVPQATWLERAESADLAAVLGCIAPDLIVVPLMSGALDCVEVAGVLRQMEYRGALRAIGIPLPRPGLVRLEVRAVYPGLDFDLVDCAHLAGMRLS